MNLTETILNFLESTGIGHFVTQVGGWDIVKYLLMYALIIVLYYFAIVRKYEPLLLIPIATGML
ncbi:MAG: glutaconyl-CoA decarboxylase subunit beta, partial [Clostridia bacterium]|nr:glutaconyl-CoA decarboxylase subunit beta [Clostridia bacterium]